MQGDLRQRRHLAADPDLEAPAAALHARLHRPAFSRTSSRWPGIVMRTRITPCLGGFAMFEGRRCMVLGQQKGRDTKERKDAELRDGQSRGIPEGDPLDAIWRRKLRHARSSRSSTPREPIPGVGSEESAISPKRSPTISARWPCSKCRVIATVIGEGGSGGALGNRRGRPGPHAGECLLLGHQSQKGCAAILWKDCQTRPRRRPRP